jgi:DNA-binding transcriptional LysR family regulator
MVEAGVGVGIVPDFAAQRYRRTMDFEILPLDEPWVERERSILVRNLELLPACAQSLIEAIKTGVVEAANHRVQ